MRPSTKKQTERKEGREIMKETGCGRKIIKMREIKQRDIQFRYLGCSIPIYQ
jgi:hypothetical protein